MNTHLFAFQIKFHRELQKNFTWNQKSKTHMTKHYAKERLKWLQNIKKQIKQNNEKDHEKTIS